MLDLLNRTLRYSRHNPWLAFMGTTTVAVTLMLLSIFALMAANAGKAVSSWSRDMQVVIFLDPAPSESLAKQWVTALGSIAEVEQVRYVSSREALERFRKRLADDAELVDGVDAGVLPASLEISLHRGFRNQQAVNAFVERLRKNSDWRDIHYGREWVERFDAVVKLLRLVGMAIGSVLLFASLFIISNTIRLTLVARLDEIEVMRLVGATPIYISLPFLLEGALQGAVGGALANLFGYGMYQAGVRQGLAVMLQTVGVEEVSFLPLSWQFYLVLIGALIGFLGSLVAMRSLSSE